MKITIFKIFQYSSLIGVLLTIPWIDECKSIRSDSPEIGEFYFFDSIMLFFVLVLMIQLLTYSIDFLIILFRKLQAEKIEIMEIYCYILSIIIGFLWFIILLAIRGECDGLFGPYYPWMVVALVISTGINFWKLSIINGHNFVKYKKIYENMVNWIKK